jgi:hypothetical protein
LSLGRAIRVKWGIPDGKVKSGLFLYSELQGGSLHLCQLRTDHLAPVNKIELCTDTYGISGDHINLVASTVTELDDTPLYFTNDIVIVFGPPTDYPTRFLREDDTRVRWARLDSVIVIVKGSHLCCLRSSRVSCCQVIFSLKVTIDLDLRDTLRYG